MGWWMWFGLLDLGFWLLDFVVLAGFSKGGCRNLELGKLQLVVGLEEVMDEVVAGGGRWWRGAYIRSESGEASKEEGKWVERVGEGKDYNTPDLDGKSKRRVPRGPFRRRLKTLGDAIDMFCIMETKLKMQKYFGDHS